MQTDLLSVSAWTYPHESAHHHQDFSYQSYDSTKTLTCPCHASKGSENHTVWAGYGLAPLERWLNENVGEGGVVALQLGHQLRVGCTCIAIQGGIGEDAVNGTQLGFSSDN